MITTLSEKGIKELHSLRNSYITANRELSFDGRFWSFCLSDEGIVSSRVSLEAFSLTKLSPKLSSKSRFPWICFKDMPTQLFNIESNEIEGGYDRFNIIDNSGKSLADQKPSRATLYQRGYIDFLNEDLRRDGFKVEKDILQKIFFPLEEQVRAHYFFC